MTDIIPTSVFVLTFDCHECDGVIFACTRVEDPRDDLSLRCAKCGWEGKGSFFDGLSICRLDVDNRSVEWIEHRTMPRVARAAKQSS